MSDSDTPPPVQVLPPPVSPASKGSGRKLVLIVIVCAVVGLSAISVLLSVLLPALNGARDLAKRGVCLKNLNMIGKGLALYDEPNGQVPLIQFRERVPNGVNVAPTPANTTDFDGDQWANVMGDAPMQNVWLLIRVSLIDEDDFRCPGDGDYQSREVIDAGAAKYGWHSPYNYSYGMHWPYHEDAAGKPNPAPLSGELHDDMVIFADLNPGGPVGPDRPPSNHGKLGTCVVTASGAARFMGETSSVFSFDDGPEPRGADEIYANQDGVAGGLPASATDTSMSLSGR